MEKEKTLLLLDDSEFVLATDGDDTPIKQMRISTTDCTDRCFADCQIGSTGNQCTMLWAPW